MSEQTVITPVVKRAPRGIYSARLDAGGRLKMPAKFVEHLQGLEDKVLYATFFDGLPRIFTNSSWERNLAKLADKPELRKRIAFYCDSVGGDIELDKQDRLTLPPRLREEAKLGEQTVQLRFHQDIITIHPETVYDSRFADVRERRDADQGEAVSMGMGDDL
jgi:DNA-binding transcriptional regulator/RsmH inhibitor MraZ